MKALVLWLTFLLAPAAWAQTVSIYTSVDSIRVGEPFLLTLVAHHGVTSESLLPDTGRAFAGGDVSILGEVQRGTTFGGASAPGTRLDSVVFRVAAFALDTLVVPPVAVGFVRGADTLLVPSPALRVRMIATAPPDAEELRPARARMDFPLPLWVWGAALAGVALAALLLYALFRRMRRRTPEAFAAAPALAPADEARQRITALAAYDLSDPEQVKPYYVELTEALRQYLERATGIPALEQTSAELVRAAHERAQAGIIPPTTVSTLADLLSVADFAKFAEGRPAPAEGARGREAALALVDQIEAFHQPQPVAEESPADA